MFDVRREGERKEGNVGGGRYGWTGNAYDYCQVFGT